MTKNGIVYLVIADDKYKQKLAFIFLNEVSNLFMEEGWLGDW